MRTIEAREVEQQGLCVVDERLLEGPLHIQRDGEPAYVIMTEAHYIELVEAWRDEREAGIREALADVAAGRVKRGTADDLIRELGLEE
jgi:PHD/YefM family antitoxin component YafN of YafNO toxin-antitoxin module